MNYQLFLEQLPNLYDNWGKISASPKSDRFQLLLDRSSGTATANVMQLLNFAVGFMEPGEIYCEIGCFQGETLIAALLERSEQLAYAVDKPYQFEEDENNLEQLINNLSEFSLEDRVIFCEQDFEEFFWE
jgi:protein O-GlcNAc transferase